jgi:6-phosphogluconolactonase/glucosamine-6-phosphate isomerase/deaminase
LIVPYGFGWRAAVQHDKSFYWGDERFVDFKHRVANELANDKEFLEAVEKAKEKNGGKWTW